MIKTHGIHHISSIVGHAQRNIDFYAGILGLRLVKQTLNFDDKSLYHLYFGNEKGDSGLITTFPMNNAQEGMMGGGQIKVASYGVRPKSFEFWEKRFKEFGIKTFYYTKFDKKRLGFKDLDQLEIELIETEKGNLNHWEFNKVESTNAIIGIENATIYSKFPGRTLKLLIEILGYELIDQDDETYLLKINDSLGGLLELNKHAHQSGVMGVGSVHHIAFSVLENEIDAWKEKLVKGGYHPTEVKDRKYFKSIYFRETGGLLIELATMGPGVLVDEELKNLGQTLQIPPHFQDEDHSHLMPIFVREIDELKNYGYRDQFEYEHLEKREKIRNEISQLKQKDILTIKEQEQLERLKQQYRNKKGTTND